MRALVVVVTALASLGSGCRARDDRRPPPAPAGGVALPAADAGGEVLVENARAYPVRSFGIAIDLADIHVADVHMTTALAPVLDDARAEVAFNGGFFDPQGKPIGLVLSRGDQIAPLASQLSGGVLVVDQERARLFASEGFVLPEHTRFAIQCRPRLVVDGAPNVKSDDGHRAERTALCIRGEGRLLDVVVVRGNEDESGPSLFGLARYLAARGCEGALNLDGGPSTGIAWREDGVVRVVAPRRPIRHAVVFARGGEDQPSTRQ